MPRGSARGGPTRLTVLERIDERDWRFGMRLGHGKCEECGAFASGCYDDEVVPSEDDPDGEADGGLYCYACWKRYLAYKPPMKKRPQPSNEWPKPEPRATTKAPPRPADVQTQLGHDAWCCVFDNIEQTEDALRVRLVCAEANRAFDTLLKGPSDAYPAAGMIIPAQCMQCRSVWASPDDDQQHLPRDAPRADGPVT